MQTTLSSRTDRTAGARRVKAATIAAALTLLVAACGGDDSSETSAEATSSPLAEFLGQDDLIADPAAAQAQFAEQERARQEIIAECMQREGFEYTPIDFGQLDVFSEDLDDYGSDEWVAEWGFGITTQRFSQRQVGPNLKGRDDAFDEAAETFVDPNEDYLESLSESEREAYERALRGDPDSFGSFGDESLTEEELDELFEEEGFTFEPEGCEGEAYEQDQAQAFYIDFQDELNEMYERLEADPRIAGREAEISDCVADKGHDFTNMESLYERWESDLQTIDPYADGFEPDFGVSEEEMAQMTDDELDELFSQEFEEPELSEESKAKLAEIQAEEIEIALAVNECDGGFDAQLELFREVQAEYEQEFLDTYADELESYEAS